MEIVISKRQCVTNAPQAYDYGWSKTLINNLYIDDRGKIYRLVEVSDDFHFNNQIQRYGSGLNVTITETDDLQYRIKQRLLIPLPNPIEIFRQTFDVEYFLDNETQDNLDKLLELVEKIRSTPQVVFESIDGGMKYKLEVHGDKQLFDDIVNMLRPHCKLV